MKLTTLAITRPVVATLVSLLVIFIGIAAVLNLPMREYPDVDDPAITATVLYLGAVSEVLERDITEPIDQATSGIDGQNARAATTQPTMKPNDVPAQNNAPGNHYCY